MVVEFGVSFQTTTLLTSSISSGRTSVVPRVVRAGRWRSSSSLLKVQQVKVNGVMTSEEDDDDEEDRIISDKTAASGRIPTTATTTAPTSSTSKNHKSNKNKKPAITPEDEICFCQNVLERLKESKDPIVKMSGFALLNSLSWSYLNKIPADTKFYNQVLELLCKSPSRTAPQDAMDILRQMEDQSTSFVEQQQQRQEQPTTNKNVGPTLDTYVHVMKTWINAEKAGVVRNGHLVAEMLLIELWEKYNEQQQQQQNSSSSCKNSSNKQQQQPLLKPDSSIYKRVLNAWARRSPFDPNAGKQAEYWLRDMVRRYLDDQDEDVQPAPVHFNAVLQCWLNAAVVASDDDDDADENEQQDHIAQLMELEKPFERTSSWSELYVNLFREFTVREDPAGTGEAAEAALRLLNYVTTTSTGSNNNNNNNSRRRNILLPHHEREATELVVRELCFSDRIYEADALLKSLQQRYDAGEWAMKPSPESLDLVFARMCKVRHKQGPKEKAIILKGKERAPKSLKQKDRTIQLRYFENAIAAWTTSSSSTDTSSNNLEEVMKAEDLFNEMQDDFSLDPTPRIYRCLVKAWASVETSSNNNDDNDDDTPAKKAQFHLSEMVLRLKKGDKAFQPDVRLFEFVLLAWLRRNRPEKAEQVLRGFHFLSDQGILGDDDDDTNKTDKNNKNKNIASTPRVQRSYEALLISWARTGPQRKENGDRAMALFEEMKKRGIPITNRSYAYLLGLWTRRPDAYSMRMVNRLFDDYRKREHTAATEKADVVVYNLVLKMWSNDRIPGFDDNYAIVRAERLMGEMRDAADAGNEKIRPDLITYTTMIQLLNNCRDFSAPEKAEDLLEELKQQTHIQPDLQIYNAVINVWARASKRTESTQRVLELLNEMNTSDDESIRPDIYTMNTVISTIAKGRGGGTSSPHRAKAMIDSMWEKYEAGESTVTPDIITYNTLAGAWSRYGTDEAPVEATKLLKEMWHMYNQGKMKHSPDSRTYSSVIAAWARSNHPAAGERAEQLLNDLRARFRASGNDGRFRPDRVLLQHVGDAKGGTSGGGGQQQRDRPRRRYYSSDG